MNNNRYHIGPNWDGRTPSTLSRSYGVRPKGLRKHVEGWAVALAWTTCIVLAVVLLVVPQG